MKEEGRMGVGEKSGEGGRKGRGEGRDGGEGEISRGREDRKTIGRVRGRDR